MIRLTPPRMPLVAPPTRRGSVRPVLPVGDAMAVAEVAGMVRVDLYGQVFDGRVSTLLTPADAQRLAMELGILARNLGG